MGQKLVVDTSILIDYLRGGVAWESLLKDLSTEDSLFMSSIVAFELLSGLSSKKQDQIRKINRFLEYFEVVDLNWTIAKIAGEIYRDTAKNLQVPDYVIAATALELNASVVTLNKKHFRQITNLNLYPIVF